MTPPDSVGDPSHSGHTFFQQKVLGHQKSQDRTKGEAVSTWFSLVAVGGLAAVGMGVASMFVDFWVFRLGSIFGVVWVVGGAVMTLRAAALPTKVVRCPGCETEHTILARVDTYICPTCFELLLLAPKSDDDFDFLDCPYCAHRTVVSANHGTFACSECGVSLTANGAYASDRRHPCPSCAAELPVEALFCVHCDEVFDQPYLVEKEEGSPQHGMDWVAGKDPEGHVKYAKALLRHLESEVLSSPRTHHIRSPLETLDRALLSTTAAASDPETRRYVPRLVPELDAAYARLLRWEADLLDVYDHAEEIEDEAFVRDAIGVFFSEVQPRGEDHIGTRRELERLLGADLVKTGSVGPWQDQLIRWKDKETRSSVSMFMTSTTKVPDDATRLREEADRFQTWMEGRGGAR